MKIIKNFLTFPETLNFVSGVVSTCFNQDELENDIEYSGVCKMPAIQSAFCEYYTDIEFLPTEDLDEETSTENFNKNYETYMNLDIEKWLDLEVNKSQFNSMISAINEEIEVRKHKMLNAKQSPMDEFFMSLTGLVKKLESVDLESMSSLLPQLAKLGQTGLDQNKLVDLILKNRPKDHKKPAKTVTEKKPRTKKTTTKLEVVADKVEE